MVMQTDLQDFFSVSVWAARLSAANDSAVVLSDLFGGG